MGYEKTIPFNANIGRAFEIVRNTFLPLGFAIIKNTNESIELTNTSTLWTKGQNPLVGISKISVVAANDSLLVNAEFGTLRKSILYLILFILGMMIFFAVVFGITFKEKVPAYNILAPFIPWPVVIPLMAIFMKSRTSKSLDTLLANLLS